MTADRPATEPTLHSRLWAEFGEMLSPNEYAAIERIVAEAAQGAAPRAEGLDVERLAAVLWCNDVMEEGFGAGKSWDYWTDTVFPVGAEVQDIYRSRAERIAAEYLASRPSDERVPEEEA